MRKKIARNEMNAPNKLNEWPDVKVLTDAELQELSGLSGSQLARMRAAGTAPRRVRLTLGGVNGKNARFGTTVGEYRRWLKDNTAE
jgi:predicted DNA-binding transcriptional regulator AlpA